MNKLVIVTAKNCGYCSILRDSGTFSSPPNSDPLPEALRASLYNQRWGPELFWRLTTASTDPVSSVADSQHLPRVGASPAYFDVYELHLRSTGSRSVIDCDEFTLFYHSSGPQVSVRRERYVRVNDNQAMLYYDSNAEGDLHSLDFNQLVVKHFPIELPRYFSYFPLFAAFSSAEWARGLNDPAYCPYSLVIGLETTSQGTSSTGLRQWGALRTMPLVPANPIEVLQRLRLRNWIDLAIPLEPTVEAHSNPPTHTARRRVLKPVVISQPQQ